MAVICWPITTGKVSTEISANLKKQTRISEKLKRSKKKTDKYRSGTIFISQTRSTCIQFFWLKLLHIS